MLLLERVELLAQCRNGRESRSPVAQIARAADEIEQRLRHDGGTLAEAGGGAETDRIRAGLDVVAAANDLLELAAQGGVEDAGRIEGKDAERLERAVRSATIDVFTGSDDRLLRRLVIDADLGTDVADELQEALGSLSEARFRVELQIENPNRDVEVEAPEDAQPYPGG